MPASPLSILLLGGTAESYHLARDMRPLPHRLITSLAGATKAPRLPEFGEIRIGGFGGVDGLRDYLTTQKIDLVIDATHPFAATISANALHACMDTNKPLWRLNRAPWQPIDGDNWIAAQDTDHAARRLPEKGRIFLALGRRHLAPFLKRQATLAQPQDLEFFARMVDENQALITEPDLHIILGKPGDEADEKALFQRHRISHIVCRNSGGQGAYAKLAAARDLHIPVIMIARPHLAQAVHYPLWREWHEVAPLVQQLEKPNPLD